MQYNKANWDNIASDINRESTHIASSDDPAEVKWDHLKEAINKAIDKHIPHKFVKKNYSPLWLNRTLRNKLKKKAKLYKKAKASSNWDKYKSFQKQ